MRATTDDTSGARARRVRGGGIPWESPSRREITRWPRRGRGSRALSDETVAAYSPRTVRRRPWRVVEVLTSSGCRSRFIGDSGSGYRFADVPEVRRDRYAGAQPGGTIIDHERERSKVMIERPPFAVIGVILISLRSRLQSVASASRNSIHRRPGEPRDQHPRGRPLSGGHGSLGPDPLHRIRTCPAGGRRGDLGETIHQLRSTVSRRMGVRHRLHRHRFRHPRLRHNLHRLPRRECREIRWREK